MTRTTTINAEEKIDEIYWGLQYDLMYLKNKDVSIEYILGNFIAIQSAEHQNRNYGVGIGDICLEAPTGLGGGRSSKAFNIVFDLRRLMKVVFDKGTDFIGASPIGVVITAIKLCAQIYNLRHIHIDERHAIVVVALWQLKSPVNGLVYGAGLLSRVNKLFREVSRSPLTSPELSIILGNLHNLRCIQMNPNGTIMPREKIKNSYNLGRLYEIS